MRPGDSFVAQPVRSLQTMLRVIAMNNARISKAVPDGIYGPDTMQEVSALQRMSGLPQTGVVNEATWNEVIRQFGPASVNVLQAQPVEILLEPRKNWTQPSKPLCFPPAEYAYGAVYGQPNYSPSRPLGNDG